MANKTESKEMKQTDTQEKAERYFKPIMDRIDSLNLPPFIKNKYTLISAAVLTLIIIIYIHKLLDAVPNVIGKTEEQATAELKDLGFSGYLVTGNSKLAISIF